MANMGSKLRDAIYAIRFLSESGLFDIKSHIVEGQFWIAGSRSLHTWMGGRERSVDQSSDLRGSLMRRRPPQPSFSRSVR